MSFYEDADGNKYVVGADSVPKKLGSSTISRLLYYTFVGTNGASGTISYTAPDDIDSLALNITAGVYSTHSNSVSVTFGDIEGTTLIDTVFEYPTKTYGRHIGYAQFSGIKKGTTINIPISCSYTPSGNTGTVYLMVDLYGIV